MAEKKLVVTENDAEKGVLHEGAGRFCVLIDKPTCGAHNVSLLTNTTNAGVAGREHTHDVEHCFYILSGSGMLIINGIEYPLKPKTAAFIPPNTTHQIIADEKEDLEYLVLYSPPGEEQKMLREQGLDSGGKEER